MATVAQQDIERYIQTQFAGGYHLKEIGDFIIELEDFRGDTMRFTMNLFGDIMDADTKQIIAISNLPHTLGRLAISDRPTSWENQPSYFG